MRTHHHNVNGPGSCEGCGATIVGELFWTLTTTNIFSVWTKCACVWSKLAVGVKAALIGIEAHLPFPLTDFDSDNGSEFINYGLPQHFHNHKPPIYFTRSRPYEKNDQAYVEQKNFSVVRQFLGYQRPNNPELNSPLNDLFCGCWRNYVKFFLPTLKLIRKETAGSKTRRV